jgi:guanylate kinase
LNGKSVTASLNHLGKLFLLVGPPGVGKNELMKGVQKRLSDLRQLPTATTRPPRPNEEHGIQHLFVTQAEFRQMLADGALLEWQEIHSSGNFYGVPRTTVENAIAANEDLIADIEVLGATYIRSLYPENVVLVFITPAPPTADMAQVLDILRARMEDRQETSLEINKRLHRVEMEMAYAPLGDYLIVNDDLDTAIDTLHSIIVAERSRRNAVLLRAARELPRHHLSYVARAVPVYQDSVLCRIHSADGTASAPFPTGSISYGEPPHQAALRVLQGELSLSAVSTENLLHDPTVNGSFIAPSALSSVLWNNARSVAFDYLYLIAERIPAPAGWAWVRYDQAGLAPALIEALTTLSAPRPGD